MEIAELPAVLLGKNPNLVVEKNMNNQDLYGCLRLENFYS
jgi:hypothetical protein